jgi:TPR repeat protein
MGLSSWFSKATESADSLVNHRHNLAAACLALRTKYSNVMLVDQPQYLWRYSSLHADDPRLDLGTLPIKRPALCIPKHFMKPGYWDTYLEYDELDQHHESEYGAHGGLPIVWLVTFYDGFGDGKHDTTFSEMFPEHFWQTKVYPGSSDRLGDIDDWFKKVVAFDFRVPSEILDQMAEVDSAPKLRCASGEWKPVYELNSNTIHELRDNTTRSFVGSEVREYKQWDASISPVDRVVDHERDSLDAALAYQKMLIGLAESGDPIAQQSLSTMYARGHGFGMLQGLIQRDILAAIKWATRAVDSTDAPALYELAVLHDTLRAYAKPYSRALIFYWAKQAADLGHEKARAYVDHSVALTLGITRGPGDDLERIKGKAASGNPEAQVMLGLLYEFGHLANADIFEAQRWYEEAADHHGLDGLDGVRQLGLLFLKSKRADSTTEAIAYLEIAARAGDALADKMLERLQ